MSTVWDNPPVAQRLQRRKREGATLRYREVCKYVIMHLTTISAGEATIEPDPFQPE